LPVIGFENRLSINIVLRFRESIALCNSLLGYFRNAESLPFSAHFKERLYCSVRPTFPTGLFFSWNYLEPMNNGRDLLQNYTGGVGAGKKLRPRRGKDHG
jgi:hypothetical protein